MKKHLIVAGAVTAVGLASVAGVTAVSAHGWADQPDIASKIATKFNLNKEEVQKVLDESFAERIAKHEAHMQERVAQAVKDGTLTQDQADQLTAKLKELHVYHESLAGKAPQEIREAMKAKWQEYKTWAQQNNIPQNVLGKHMMAKHGHMHGE